jgi:hypothetical protein
MVLTLGLTLFSEELQARSMATDSIEMSKDLIEIKFKGCFKYRE